MIFNKKIKTEIATMHILLAALIKKFDQVMSQNEQECSNNQLSIKIDDLYMKLNNIERMLQEKSSCKSICKKTKDK